MSRTSALLLALLAPAAWAQNAPALNQPSSTAWQQCSAMGDSSARLACFDQWANQQASQPTTAALPAPATNADRSASALNNGAAPASAALPAVVSESSVEPSIDINGHAVRGCVDPQFSTADRFWELSGNTDCGTFSFRGYRPLTVSVVAANRVDDQPYSPAPGREIAPKQDYKTNEMRLQLSVRTKVAQGLLTNGNDRKDSLWLGYTQQSYWQVFSPAISRPFRTTDHEPEIVYVYPTSAQLPWGWNWRFSGLGLVHQSNGQSLPLSRSWNRVYLMTGFEKGNDWIVQGRIWKRLKENAPNDDNPGITDYYGRAELQAHWNINQDHTVGAIVRSSLGSADRGSVRLEWLRSLGKGLTGGKSNLRLHTQLFTGYGDSLIDYNYKRTVLSVGFTLLDF